MNNERRVESNDYYALRAVSHALCAYELQAGLHELPLRGMNCNCVA